MTMARRRFGLALSEVLALTPPPLRLSAREQNLPYFDADRRDDGGRCSSQTARSLSNSGIWPLRAKIFPLVFWAQSMENPVPFCRAMPFIDLDGPFASSTKNFQSFGLAKG